MQICIARSRVAFRRHFTGHAIYGPVATAAPAPTSIGRPLEHCPRCRRDMALLSRTLGPTVRFGSRIVRERWRAPGHSLDRPFLRAYAAGKAAPVPLLRPISRFDGELKKYGAGLRHGHPPRRHLRAPDFDITALRVGICRSLTDACGGRRG
jgi:hypothetical protein